MTYNYDRRASEGTDRSDHPTIVEYAVQTILKKKSSPEAAAKDTVKKHSGSENMFFGPGITIIDPKKLEAAVYERFVDMTIKTIPRVKEGMAHFALDSTLQHFYGLSPKPFAKKVREKLKGLVIRQLGKDPFVNDDS